MVPRTPEFATQHISAGWLAAGAGRDMPRPSLTVARVKHTPCRGGHIDSSPWGKLHRAGFAA